MAYYNPYIQLGSIILYIKQPTGGEMNTAHFSLEGRGGLHPTTFENATTSPCRTPYYDSTALRINGVQHLHPTLRGERHIQPCFNGLFDWGGSAGLGNGFSTQHFRRLVGVFLHFFCH